MNELITKELFEEFAEIYRGFAANKKLDALHDTMQYAALKRLKSIDETLKRIEEKMPNQKD